MWTGKTIVLGVTGGIAAYKAAELAGEIRRRGAATEVVMTDAACLFITPLTFRELTGRQVSIDAFASSERMEVQHIGLATRADLIVIAPATANTIAKIAHGIADNLLTAVVLATKKPVLLAPAMNTGMYENDATQANLNLLIKRGMTIVGPASGQLLCGSVGAGRLSPLTEILFAMERVFSPQDFLGRKIIVTAGGTREPVDPVRFLGNRSSGRMGVALAKVFARRGAEVVLVAGVMEIEPPPVIELIRAESTGEMREQVLAHLPGASAVVLAGAPADFRAARPSGSKIKREGRTELELALIPTEDIAAEVGRRKRADQMLVIFAAETEDLRRNARLKLERKGADLAVANDVTSPDSGFGTETNQVCLITRTDEISLPLLPKDETAWAIADAMQPFFTRDAGND